MAKKTEFMQIIIWIVGVLVSLAVGFGMTSLTLSIPYIPDVVTQIAGWIVVIGTIVGVVMALIKAAK